MISACARVSICSKCIAHNEPSFLLMMRLCSLNNRRGKISIYTQTLTGVRAHISAGGTEMVCVERVLTVKTECYVNISDAAHALRTKQTREQSTIKRCFKIYAHNDHISEKETNFKAIVANKH